MVTGLTGGKMITGLITGGVLLLMDIILCIRNKRAYRNKWSLSDELKKVIQEAEEKGRRRVG